MASSSLYRRLLGARFDELPEVVSVVVHERNITFIEISDSDDDWDEMPGLVLE